MNRSPVSTRHACRRCWPTWSSTAIRSWSASGSRFFSGRKRPMPRRRQTCASCCIRCAAACRARSISTSPSFNFVGDLDFFSSPISELTQAFGAFHGLFANSVVYIFCSGNGRNFLTKCFSRCAHDFSLSARFARSFVFNGILQKILRLLIIV